MPFVLYATPWFSENATHYLDKLISLPNVRVAVLTHDPAEKVPPILQERLAAHWRINNMFDIGETTHAAQVLSQHFGPVHRIVSHQEQFQVPLAELRERLQIPGLTVQAAHNFRDKAQMKRVFQEAGIPCARFRHVANADDAWHFANEVGYPLVVKPVAGAASQSTFRVDGPDQLWDALASNSPTPSAPVIVEEFIIGDEHSFESYTLNGEILWHSLTHYYPAPLEVVRNPWIQWTALLPKELDAPQYDDIRAAAAKALKALGMDTGLSHLEWFRRKDGSIAISEVAARPPGAQFTTLMSIAHDFDSIHAWLRLIVEGEFDPPARKYAAGAAYLRPQGQGRIKAVHGLEQAHHEFGSLVVAAKLPQVGQHTSTSYEGDGYILIRHSETEVVKQALQRLTNIIQIELE